jgi:peptide-methionine (R)-S-oxide reductase
MLTYNHIVTYARKGNVKPINRVEKSDDEWKSSLTEEQFYVTRMKGTEARMSSGLCTLYEPGIYTCICCGTELFDSASKYDSRSGWPSLTEPTRDDVVSYHEDESHGMSRIEVTCSTCDAHLGHVFPDGPEPSGLRFCMNGIALKKK